jgi:hypothetical protein
MRTVLAACAALAIGVAAARADEPVLLGNEAGGLLKITTERSLVVRGIEGRIDIEPGPAGELRFLSTEPENTDRDVPIAAWEDGSAVVLRPPAGETPRPRRVGISVPPGFAVRVEAKNTSVGAFGLPGPLDLAGEKLSIDAQSCKGPLNVEADASVVRISNASDRTMVRGKDVDLRIATGSGEIALYLTGKVAGIRDFQGRIDADLNGTDFVVEAAEGPLSVQQRGGTALVTGLRQGGTFEISQAPLRLFQSEGELTVHSDADVQLKDTKASVRLDLFGGTLRGSANDGKVEATTDGTEIILERMTGPLKIGAKNGSVRLSESFGDVSLETSGSEVKIDKLSGKLAIVADGGDVTLQRVSAEVDVRSRGGDVRLLEQGGSARVVADGREVEVAWLSVPSGRDCLVQNDGGDVIVRFLGGSGGHVSAQAPSGRVETDLREIVVDQGGTSAQGVVGASKQPNVVVKAAGNVELTGAPGGEGEP